jgi:hypothetical protein
MKIISTFVFLISTLTFSQDSNVLRELNTSKVNLSFENYDPDTALYCGQLSELAYAKEKNIEEFLKLLKETSNKENINFRYLSNEKSDTQALLWCTSKFLVIAFRGTEPSVFKDLITDGKFWNYKNNPSYGESLANMPPGHGGFRKSLMRLIKEEKLFEEIDIIIKKTKPEVDTTTFPIILTGHSLGAALSQLFIESITYKGYNFQGAYHFAPPLAVSCDYKDYMKKNYGSRVYDIINYKDYIPRAGRNYVAHFGNFYRICDDSKIYKADEAYVKFTFKEYFNALKYHKLSNHLAAIRMTENNLENIKSRSNEQFPCLGKNIQNIDPCGFPTTSE